MLAYSYTSNKFHGNFNQNTTALIEENEFENVMCKMAAILFRPQCVEQGWASVGTYLQTSNVICTLVDDKIVDHSHVVGASTVGATPTTSSFST